MPGSVCWCTSAGGDQVESNGGPACTTSFIDLVTSHRHPAAARASRTFCRPFSRCLTAPRPRLPLPLGLPTFPSAMTSCCAALCSTSGRTPAPSLRPTVVGGRSLPPPATSRFFASIPVRDTHGRQASSPFPVQSLSGQGAEFGPVPPPELGVPPANAPDWVKDLYQDAEFDEEVKEVRRCRNARAVVSTGGPGDDRRAHRWPGPQVLIGTDGDPEKIRAKMRDANDRCGRANRARRSFRLARQDRRHHASLFAPQGGPAA